MKVENPKALLFATGCGGYVLGELKTIITVAEKFITNSNINKLTEISSGDLIYIIIVVAAIVLAMVFGVIAFSSKSETQKILEKIRKRSPVILNLGQNESQGSINK